MSTDVQQPETDVVAPAKRVRAKRTIKQPELPYYKALKKLSLVRRNGRRVTYKPGDIVPEAKDWLRVEAWVRSRHLEKIEA